jgi:hypothetical protein
MRGNANSRHLPVKVPVRTKARRLPVKVTHTVVPLVVPAATSAAQVRDHRLRIGRPRGEEHPRPDRIEPGAGHP